MKKINKIKYVVLSMFLFSASSPVLAQWGIGQGNAQRSQLPAGSVTDIIMQIMYWLLGIVGFIGVIGFVISGILYLTATGDEEKITTAKKAMTWSIVGVIVALMGYVIIQAVDIMLGGGNARF